MNHLYRIVDKEGNSIPFRLNPIQQEVLENLHKRNLILKARQLGMSTFSIIYLLDEAIFNENLSCGIVSYSREHAQYIFKRVIGHAIDSLKPYASSLAGVVQRSSTEVTFQNGSVLRVDTTLRGGAYQRILVSEFGKTCARNPLKAEEVVTGTLQAVSKEGMVIIESTGEGNSGYYADMVNAAHLRGNEDLSELEYYLFFFPWYLEPSYSMQKEIEISTAMSDYFDKVESEGNIKLTKQQKFWYLFQMSVLGDKMKQEFPSTVAEAFITSSDAYYFQQALEKAYQDKRILSSPLYDPLEAVYVAMDIGINDLTVMTFFQVIHGEIRIIDYYEDNNKGVDFYARFLRQEKPYLYHTIFLPHDAARRDGIIVENSYEREFKKLFQGTNVRFIVLKKTDKSINIAHAKNKLERCVFCERKTKPLIDMLMKYRKKWSEQYGKYLDQPMHDISSHYADSFIYAMQAVSHIERSSNLGLAYEKHQKLVKSRKNLF